MGRSLAQTVLPSVVCLSVIRCDNNSPHLQVLLERGRNKKKEFFCILGHDAVYIHTYTGIGVWKERTAISTTIQEPICWTNLNMEPVGSFETSVPTMKFVSTAAYRFTYTA